MEVDLIRHKLDADDAKVAAAKILEINCGATATDIIDTEMDYNDVNIIKC